MQSIEEWRPVAQLNGYYEVSDLGRIRVGVQRRGSGPVGKIVKTWPQPPSGHHLLTALVDREKRRIRVHRLVAIEFLGDPGSEFEVCHNDGDPANNRLDNLRWDTHAANMRDAMRHGTFRAVTPATRQSHCIYGHEFDAVNTGISSDGSRYCLACGRRRARERYYRLREDPTNAA